MKKILLIAVAALLALVSCQPQDAEPASLDGRWNAAREPGGNDVALSLIFNGDKLDMYIIAWGQHYTGTYTYVNDVVTFNITAGKKAWTEVTFDEEGNMTSWSWSAGNLDPVTLKLKAGYDWYPIPAEDLAHDKEEFGSFEFKVNGDTATSSILGIPNLVYTRVK